MLTTNDKVLDETVWVDPERMGGVACFKGTRLPVELFFQCLAEGMSIDEFLESYDSANRTQLEELLKWAMERTCMEAGAFESFAR